MLNKNELNKLAFKFFLNALDHIYVCEYEDCELYARITQFCSQEGISDKTKKEILAKYCESWQS